MSSSLEELLAEGGFRGRRSVSSSRSSLSSKTRTMPASRDQRKMDCPSVSRIGTERTRSDVSRYRLRGELPVIIDDNTGRRPRDNLVGKDKTVGDSKKENWEIFEGKGSNSVQKGRKVGHDSEDFMQNEIVEVGLEENHEVKDVYFNEVPNLEKRASYSRGVGEKEERRRRSGKGIKIYEKHSSSGKHMLRRASFGDRQRKTMNQHGSVNHRSNRGLQNSKSFVDEEIQKQDRFVQPVSQPALDDVAVKALVSILNSYVNHFLKNKDFRTSLHHNCFLSLNFTGLEDRDADSNVITNLEEAVKVVERAAEDSASAKELKKALFQLHVITGLNSDDLKNEFTLGIPNYKLSACAQLYLSIIFKLQKKDRISAKHLLQVFCDSPSQARMTLLPELWEDMFSPHLSHLKDWYNQEAESLVESPTRAKKLKLLDQVCNDILDSGTYQFAVYYKDWLSEWVEAPSVPCIHIPLVSLEGFQQGDSVLHTSEVTSSAAAFSPTPVVSKKLYHSNKHVPTLSLEGFQQGDSVHYAAEVASPAAAFSPKPMVSKKLFDDVFRQSHKPGYDVNSGNFDAYYDRSSEGSADVKQTLTYSSEAIKQPNQDIEQCSSESGQDDEFFHDDGVSSTAEEKWRIPLVHLLQEKDVHGKDKSSEAFNTRQTTAGDAHMSRIPPQFSVNEIILKRLAKSAFELQQTENPVDLSVSCLPQLTEPIQVRNSFEELHETYVYFAGASYFSSIPVDFICPLTGKLFEDPVTLETGQSFEKIAIKEWFDGGNRTCPVAGKTLEYLSVPHTNFVLKRVIDSWKAENHRHLLNFG
ncbi:hypothetical protein SLA2020_421260 [Shorea laevis]